MTQNTATTMPIAELTTALRTSAGGRLNKQAGIGLLIEHEMWLHHTGFRAAYIETEVEDGVTYAGIDWEQLTSDLAIFQSGGDLSKGLLPNSSTELQMLEIACSFAGIPPRPLRVCLSDVLGGLDRTNTTLVATAIIHAQYGGALPGWDEVEHHVTIAQF